MQEIALVYMVAGISSRFEGRIKQLEPVGKNNETLIECSLNQALPAGFTKIIFIVGNKTEQPFKEKFGNSYKGIPIYYALQKFDEATRERPWGSVDALCAVKNIIDCPFIVCNGDDLYDKEAFKILINHIKENPYAVNATIGYKLKNSLPENGKANRAIFQLNSDNTVKSLKEILGIEKSRLKELNLSGEDLCSMNIFALEPKTIEKLKIILKDFKEKNKGDKKIECFLPNEISRLIQEKRIKLKIYPTESKTLGITNPGDELIVREALKNLKIIKK